MFIKSREALAAIIGNSVVVFLQFKEFELYWGPSSFFSVFPASGTMKSPLRFVNRAIHSF